MSQFLILNAVTDCLQLVLLLPGAVALNGQRAALPVVTADLAVRRASSSFLLIQAFGAQLLWHLDGPLAFITLQPGFASKVTMSVHINWNGIYGFKNSESQILMSAN